MKAEERNVLASEPKRRQILPLCVQCTFRRQGGHCSGKSMKNHNFHNFALVELVLFYPVVRTLRTFEMTSGFVRT